MLSPAQIAARRDITASFLSILMEGTALATILNKWRELVGDPAFEPEDFSKNWPAYYGTFMEAPSLDWHQLMTGQPLTRRGEVVVHPTRPFFSCTLDAYRESDDCVLDVKCCGAYRSLDEIERYYTPQIIGQMRCTGAARGALLVVHAGGEPRELPIYVDPDYERVLWKRVDAFQRCVETLTPPVPLPTVVPPDRWRTIDLDVERDSYNWAPAMIENLFLWSTSERTAKDFEAAKQQIKELLPADVGTVYCAGLAVVRARNNAVTIKHKRAAA